LGRAWQKATSITPEDEASACVLCAVTIARFPARDIGLFIREPARESADDAFEHYTQLTMRLSASPLTHLRRLGLHLTVDSLAIRRRQAVSDLLANALALTEVCMSLAGREYGPPASASEAFSLCTVGVELLPGKSKSRVLSTLNIEALPILYCVRWCGEKVETLAITKFVLQANGHYDWVELLASLSRGLTLGAVVGQRLRRGWNQPVEHEGELVNLQLDGHARAQQGPPNLIAKAKYVDLDDSA